MVNDSFHWSKEGHYWPEECEAPGCQALAPQMDNEAAYHFLKIYFLLPTQIGTKIGLFSIYSQTLFGFVLKTKHLSPRCAGQLCRIAAAFYFGKFGKLQLIKE